MVKLMMENLNYNLSNQFKELSQLILDYQEKAEDPYRAAAYRKVSDILQHLQIPVDRLTPSELSAIPGIGSSTIRNIQIALKRKDRTIPDLVDKRQRCLLDDSDQLLRPVFAVAKLNQALSVEIEKGEVVLFSILLPFGFKKRFLKMITGVTIVDGGQRKCAGIPIELNVKVRRQR